MSKYDKEPELFLIAGERVTLKELQGDDLQFALTCSNNYLTDIIFFKLNQMGDVKYNKTGSTFEVNAGCQKYERPNMVDITDARSVLESLKADESIAKQLRNARALDARELGPTNYKGR